jgi:hypothetical protein
MALPNSNDLKGMDYTCCAQPFIEAPAKSIDLTTMDYTFQAQPFVRNPYSTPSSGIVLSGAQHLSHIDLTWTGW